MLSDAYCRVCNFCCPLCSDVVPCCLLALTYKLLNDLLRREVLFSDVAVVRCRVVFGEVVGVIKLP